MEICQTPSTAGNKLTMLKYLIQTIPLIGCKHKTFLFCPLHMHVCLLPEPRVLQLALDPLPLQQPSTFIIYYHTTHTHAGVHTQTFIIYCGNVLNAWLNTGTQIHPAEGTGMGKSGLGLHTHKLAHLHANRQILTYLH